MSVILACVPPGFSLLRKANLRKQRRLAPPHSRATRRWISFGTSEFAKREKWSAHRRCFPKASAGLEKLNSTGFRLRISRDVGPFRFSSGAQSQWEYFPLRRLIGTRMHIRLGPFLEVM